MQLWIFVVAIWNPSEFEAEIKRMNPKCRSYTLCRQETL